jgi:hypothetical protein
VDERADDEATESGIGIGVRIGVAVDFLAVVGVLTSIDFSNYWNSGGIWVFLVHFFEKNHISHISINKSPNSPKPD